MIEIGEVVVEIRLADLCVCSADVGDELSYRYSIKAFSWVIEGGIVNVIDGCCELVPCDGVDNHVGRPSLAKQRHC